jgi:hypothetical protein
MTDQDLFHAVGKARILVEYLRPRPRTMSCEFSTGRIRLSALADCSNDASCELLR